MTRDAAQIFGFTFNTLENMPLFIVSGPLTSLAHPDFNQSLHLADVSLSVHMHAPKLLVSSRSFALNFPDTVIYIFREC